MKIKVLVLMCIIGIISVGCVDTNVTTLKDSQPTKSTEQQLSNEQKTVETTKSINTNSSVKEMVDYRHYKGYVVLDEIYSVQDFVPRYKVEVTIQDTKENSQSKRMEYNIVEPELHTLLRDYREGDTAYIEVEYNYIEKIGK